MRTYVLILSLIFTHTAFAQKDLGVNPGFPDVESINMKDGVIHCLTNEVWRERKEQIGRANFKAAGPCDEGNCDDPAVRDATAINNITIDVVVHVMRDNNGNNGVSQATVNATIAQMNADYAASGTGIQFNLTQTQFHNDSNYACISAYSPFSSTWYNEILQMRQDYAVTPADVANIYIGCQDSSPWGILMGIATFPWDPAALTNTGGFWLNNVAAGSGATTASHEMGHCLGLWHTQHGVSEVDSCSTCYELADGTDGDVTGDFCSDTPPTPTNQNCSDPGGSDCAGTPWGDTQEENIMGYSSCRSVLTTQQSRRMQCWTNAVLSSWTSGGGPVNQAPTASFTYTANNLAVSFDGSGSSDSDGTISSYAWNFGDGNNGSGATAGHTYASGGTYTVTLTVTDNDGATDSSSQSVTVTSGGTGGTWTTLVSSDFESGWQGWSDGGSDCRRSSNDSAYASQGNFCVRIRDNSGAASSFFRNDVNMSGYTEGRVSFNYNPVSFEGSEDFFVEVNDGSGWSVIGQLVNGSDFTNNNPSSASFTFNSSSYSFGSGFGFRIRCDASANNDRAYIDEVVIEGK